MSEPVGQRLPSVAGAHAGAVRAIAPEHVARARQLVHGAYLDLHPAEREEIVQAYADKLSHGIEGTRPFEPFPGLDSSHPVGATTVDVVLSKGWGTAASNHIAARMLLLEALGLPARASDADIEQRQQELRAKNQGMRLGSEWTPPSAAVTYTYPDASDPFERPIDPPLSALPVGHEFETNPFVTDPFLTDPFLTDPYAFDPYAFDQHARDRSDPFGLGSWDDLFGHS